MTASLVRPDTISLAICSARRLEYLQRCLTNLDAVSRGMRHFKLEVVLLHAYTDEEIAQLGADGFNYELRAIHEDTLDLPSKGWPVLYNAAMSETTGVLTSFYSDDIVLIEGSLEAAAIHVLENERTAAAAFAWRNHDDIRFRIGHVVNNDVLINFGIIRRDVFDQVGGITEEFAFYHADSDLSLKMIDAGYRISALPTVRILHFDLNRGQMDIGATDADWDLYLERWKPVFGDPVGYWIWYP